MRDVRRLIGAVMASSMNLTDKVSNSTIGYGPFANTWYNTKQGCMDDDLGVVFRIQTPRNESIPVSKPKLHKSTPKTNGKIPLKSKPHISPSYGHDTETERVRSHWLSYKVFKGLF